MALSKDLVAASATPLILSILEKGDSYGYAIIEEVRLLSGGELAWADGMLYPILHRLERKKQIKSYWGSAENGRKRKYYKLSNAGKKALTEQRQHWTKLHDMLMQLQGGKACLT